MCISCSGSSTQALPECRQKLRRELCSLCVGSEADRMGPGCLPLGELLSVCSSQVYRDISLHEGHETCTGTSLKQSLRAGVRSA